MLVVGSFLFVLFAFNILELHIWQSASIWELGLDSFFDSLCDVLPASLPLGLSPAALGEALPFSNGSILS